MTEGSTATDIPEFPMMRAPGCPFAPPPTALELNADKQLSRVRIWDDSTPWLIHGYDTIRALFTDSRTSVDDRLPGYPHWNEGMLATVHKRPRSVFTSDAEEHTRFRRMLSKPFTFKRVEALRPAVQKITDDHIDDLLAGPKPGDVVSALSLAVPSLVISELLGVPYEDAEFFQTHAQRGVSRYATEEDTAQGAAALAKYLANLVRTKMQSPSEDLVSDLAERVNAEELSVREAAQLAVGVLIAGHETTANMISLSIAALLEHPDQRALLCDTDDPKVVATAVEELMRYLSITRPGSDESPSRTSRLAGRRSGPATASSSTSRPPTGTPANSPTRTASTCAGTRDRTSVSATAATSVWGSNSPASNCRSSCPPCCAASRRCGSPCRWTNCRSSTTRWPTASTSFP